MEEKQKISIEVFNQIHHLRREDFLSFNQIVTEQDLKDLKIPFNSLDSHKTRVLNIMIYYIISIQKSFNTFPQDNYGDKYRKFCAKEISDYYIKNKFVIEEYEFSYLASKALSKTIQECAHIIYYLIYGRFASHPYINSLCSKGAHGIKKNIIRKDYSLRSFKKRTIISDCSNSQIQVQNFRRDLKTALNSQNSRKYMRTDNFSDKLKKEDEKSLNMATTQRSSLKRTNSTNTFIPQRINQGENSLMFENMAYNKKSYQTLNQWNHKGLMRKQKFNQFFDINELKLKAKLKKSPFLVQQNKQNLSKNTFQLHKDSQQINKINYENFKRISTGLKNKSSTLDRIRSQCSPRNHKFIFEKQNNETLQETLQKLAQFENDRSKQFRPMNRRIKNNVEQRNSKNIINPRLSKNINKQKGILNNDPNLESEQSTNFQRHVQYLMPFQEDEDCKQGDYAVNILRNDNSHNQNQEEGKKLEFFAQTRLGFKKFDNINNLQKYKNDYRKFLKTQTLDRVKQIS